ncbi:zinc finger CCHC domain-containing protein 2 isoform X2 [Paramormyrops kingsleyae]|uniref:zinc finger CCHC domain-containing protein 2 isoform X2 n=1 Tax=Paramormyrops kingsleyae TaxID=1676925 RepID=UPI003B96F3B6
MLKMRLPMRTAEEGGDETAEDEQDHANPGLHSPGSVDQTATGVTEDSPRQLGCSLLNKEAVFEWFGLHLNPAKRIEFMCGLLHMCQPLELRFLGSCLEDLARKDFHVLRDFEMKANSPSELGLLTDVADPVVRSRLLVCLSLLGSENRECAGILFRILSHADPALCFRNHGFPASSYRDPRHPRLHPSCGDADEPGKSERLSGPLSEAGAGLLEQFALLFTMASLHPAFPFHQRETVRVQLEKVELAIREEEQLRRRGADSPNKIPQTGDFSPSTDTSPNNRAQCRHSTQSAAKKSQREAVYIEKILLKGISWSRTDKEYSFEVKWSDSSSSSVMKTHHDLEEFLLKLPKEFATESFEKSIVRLLSQGDKYESRELERTLKEKFLSAPPAFRQSGTVCSFFLSDSSGSSCSRCNPMALGKPFTEDCSEASSQEEGAFSSDLEQYVVGHRKKPGTKSPSLSQSSKSCPADGRRATPSELNGAPDWRRKSCPLKPTLEQRGPGPEQHPGDQKWNSTPSPKSKPRAAAAEREKGKVGEGRLAYVGNGIMRPAAVHPGRQPTRKDRRHDVGSGQDSYGETSSESYSSPSSPQHDGRESLESEDEKDRDTDSHSDDYSKGRVEPFPSPKRLAGAALATMRPLLPNPLKEEPSRPEGALSNPVFPQLSFVHTLPYVVQNGAIPSPDPGSATHGPDSKPVVGVAGVGTPSLGLREAVSGMVPPGEGEKLPPEPASLPHAFGPSLAGLPQAVGPAIQPLVPRFKATTLQGSSENCALPHQPPVGSVGVVPQGTSYMSPLTQAYPSTEPASLPNPAPPTEPHAKPPSLSLSAGLATPYSLPVPTSIMPSVGGVATPTVSQVQVMVPPAIPTHTPGPAPSSSPALTHSTAQSDSTSYINSTSCGTSSGASQTQQQQSTPPQQMGCGTCGCRGSCGSNHAPNYYFPPQMPRQVLSMPHIFHLTSLPHQSNGTTQLPFFPPAPYASGPLLHTHSEHVLSTQVGYGMQQMGAFNRFYPPVFPPVSMMPGGALTACMKKNSSNVSCYNCGVSGHYAQDCKQPSIDAAQQGVFRLKYVGAQSSEMIDKAD